MTKMNLKLLIYLRITNRQCQEASIWTRQGDRHLIFLKRISRRFIVDINLRQGQSRTYRREMVVRIFWTNLKICRYWGLRRSRRLLGSSLIKAKKFLRNWMRPMSIGIACLFWVKERSLTWLETKMIKAQDLKLPYIKTELSSSAFRRRSWIRPKQMEGNRKLTLAWLQPMKILKLARFRIRTTALEARLLSRCR